MKKFTIVSALMMAICTGANGQVGNIVLELPDYDSYNFIPAEASPDEKAYLEIYHRISDEWGETGDDVVDIYDSNLNKVKSVSIKLENVTDPSVTDNQFYAHPYRLHISNYNDVNCYLTQNIFNNDDKYEYIMPVYETMIPEGENEARSVEMGFKIMSEDGSTLQTVRYEEPFRYRGIYFYFYKLDGNKYLVASDGDTKTLVYRVGTSSSGISDIKAVMNMKISPRVAESGETITVELDGDNNTERTVSVVNAAGQTVWRETVPAGQSQVGINAARLNKGVNIVNVSGGKQKESCKVIVK